MGSVVLERERPELGPVESGTPRGSLAAALVSILLFTALTLGFRTLGSYPPRYMSLLVLLATLVTLMLVDGRTLLRIPVSVTWLMLWFWMALSVLWSEQPLETVQAVGRDVAIMLALYLLVGVSRLDTFVRTMLWAVRAAVAITLVAVVALPDARRLSLATSPDLAGWLGLFPHKNELGPFLAFAVVTVLCFDNQRWSRHVTLAAALLILVGTRSVTGVVGVTVALTVWWWLQLDARLDVGRRRVLRWSTAAAAVATVVLTGAGAVTLAGFVGKNATFNGRTVIWQSTLDTWAERPFLGFGLDGVLSSQVTERTATMLEDITFYTTHAHNGLLSVGLQLGIVGVALVVALLISTMIDAVRLLPDDRTVATWVIALLIAQLVMSVSENMYLGNTWVGALVLWKVVLLRRHRELSDAAAVNPGGTR